MILATERLTLREFTMADVAALHALESIPEVVRYQTYGPRTRDEAEAVVRAIVEGQGEAPRRHVELAVLCERAFIGRVGAWIEDGKAALWYASRPETWGRGLATEAVRALIPRLEAWRLTIECDPRNEASWRLAERLGFARESFEERAYESKGEWVGSMVYALSRP